MTLVAGFEFEKRPYIVGDLLLSSREKKGASRYVSIPTAPNLIDVTATEPNVSIPNALIQKTAVIGNNLVVAWAGHRVTATVVIREMSEQNSCEPFSVKAINEFLAKLEQRSEILGQDFRFLGFLVDSEGLTQFGFRSPARCHIGLLRNATVIGTGGTDLQNSANSLARADTSIGASLNATLGQVIALTGSLLSLDAVTHQSLNQLYGGGYEIVFWHRQFRKLDNVTYLYL